MKMSGHFQRMHLKMAESSCGRIALHLVLALRTSHYTWHLHGIARELMRR
jgi:hypothetical protein